MTDDLYYRKLESTSTTDLVDMIRERDKQISELEKDRDYFSDALDKQIEATLKLDKENAELQDKLKNLASVAEVRLANWQKYEKENAELKADNDARKFAMSMSEKVEKQLRNERNTFLAQNEQYEKDLIDFNENLTKAKEIISEWEDSFCCGADYLYLGNKGKELRIKSQKFLNNEVEK